MECKLFDEKEIQLSVFPILYPEINEFLDKQRSVFWTVNEIDLNTDVKEWDTKIDENTKTFIKTVLAFSIKWMPCNSLYFFIFSTFVYYTLWNIDAMIHYN